MSIDWPFSTRKQSALLHRAAKMTRPLDGLARIEVAHGTKVPALFLQALFSHVSLSVEVSLQVFRGNRHLVQPTTRV